jgi:hypothetical protein
MQEKRSSFDYVLIIIGLGILFYFFVLPNLGGGGVSVTEGAASGIVTRPPILSDLVRSPCGNSVNQSAQSPCGNPSVNQSGQTPVLTDTQSASVDRELAKMEAAEQMLRDKYQECLVAYSQSRWRPVENPCKVLEQQVTVIQNQANALRQAAGK